MTTSNYITLDKYLTNEISPIFKLISLIPSPYIDIKKGLLTIKVEKSLVVAGTGLEPAYPCGLRDLKSRGVPIPQPLRSLLRIKY